MRTSPAHHFWPLEKLSLVLPLINQDLLGSCCTTLSFTCLMGRRLDYQTWHLPRSSGGSAAGGRLGCRPRALERPPLSALLSSSALSPLQPERARYQSRSVSCEACVAAQSPLFPPFLLLRALQ